MKTFLDEMDRPALEVRPVKGEGDWTACLAQVRALRAEVEALDEQMRVVVEGVRRLCQIPMERVRVSKAERVLDLVAGYSGLTRKQLIERCRFQSRVWPRRVAMVMLREELGMSQEEIARLFGMDHTAISYGLIRAAERCSVERPFLADLEAVRIEVQQMQ